MIADHLRIRPGQQALTPEQEAEARRFAEAFIQTQLSTEPVDEHQAEALLCQAYQVAGLAAPQRIHWLDGPLQLVAALAPPNIEASVGASLGDRVVNTFEDSVNDSVRDSVVNSVEHSITRNVYHSVGANLWHSLWHSLRSSITLSIGSSVGARIGAGVVDCLWDLVQASVGASDWASVGGDVSDSAVDAYHSLWDHVWDSVRAYENAGGLAFYHFFAVYLAPNDLHAFAHFNELVSGYWLGHEVALIVRRPNVLALDAEGRLHSATGKCIEYHDGWGCYAWHGTLVPEKVILTPDSLTRDGFLNEGNVEVRRVIQEHMGNRFVSELGGVVIDHSPRGTLYEVRLPEDDPERVARYVQVQDASTERQYFLRVPPTIQTAAEAVAWTFQVRVEDYRPVQET